MKRSRSGKCGVKRGGWTRVEAVGVLGVAGTLGAIVLPVAAHGGLFDVFSRARENARRSSCQSNLKQLGLGLIQYTQDYDEKMPFAASPGMGGDVTMDPGSSPPPFGWADALYPYIKTKQVFICPSERNPNAENFSSRGFTDYWLNRAIAGKPLSIMVSPAQSLSMGDGDGGSPASTARYNIASLPSGWKTTPRSPARRHLNGANYAFLDGHVKAFPPEQISSASVAKTGNPTFAIK